MTRPQQKARTMTTKRGRTTPAKPKPTIEETPRLLRSFAADIAAAQAKQKVPLVELTEGCIIAFTPQLSAADWLDWAVEAYAREKWQFAQTMEVLRTLVAPQDAERFEAAVADRGNPIDPMIFHDVRSQLLGFYAGRPTEPPTSSSGEQSKDGAASVPGAQNDESTLSTSTPEA